MDEFRNLSICEIRYNKMDRIRWRSIIDELKKNMKKWYIYNKNSINIWKGDKRKVLYIEMKK